MALFDKDEYMRKILFCFAIVVLFFVQSCRLITGEVDDSGNIKGKIVILENNSIGIDGIIFPVGVLFPTKQKVKYLLDIKDSDYRLIYHIEIVS